MKRYFLAICAITCAITAYAVSRQNEVSGSDVLFHYTGTNYSETDVENPSNWIEVKACLCEGIDEQAGCIKVDSADTEGEAPNRTLKPTINIISLPFGTVPNLTYFVTVGGDVLAKRNHAQP